jgi:pilus assembly protein CpaC
MQNKGNALVMKRLLLIACILTLNLIGLPLQNYALDEGGEEIKLYIGEVRILPVNNPTRVVIGNPSIVDVTEVSKDEITIIPKLAGTTSLIFWDNFGEQSYKIRVVAADLSDIKRRVDNLIAKLNLPEVYTQIAEDEGKILLLGRVKMPQDREKINVALGELKDKTTDLIVVKEEESVIEIDVQVLELDKDATKALGFTWPGSTNIIETGSPAEFGTKWGKIFRVANIGREDPFSLRLDALIQEGKARVLSRPRLACQSGKEAELLVGGEKPTFTSAAVFGGGMSTQIHYKEFGIKLKIKPTVTEEKRIKLALNIEVSEVGEADIIGRADEPTAKAYPLSKRTASTELYLDNGQTMAIGGLMKQKHEEDITKTAFLGDIPILGALFRQKVTKDGSGATERGDVELFITLTPAIVGEEKKSVQATPESKPKEESPITKASETLPESLTAYAKVIQKRILDNLTYPPQAKEAGFQGAVKLSLHLSYKGEVLDAMLKQSSGYRILDDQAVSVAKGIGPYPPFPASIEQEELWIDIPISYQLN